MAESVRPPGGLRRALGSLLPAGDRDSVLTELDVLYERRAARYGRIRADAWYAAQLPSFAVRLATYAIGNADRGRGAGVRMSGDRTRRSRGLRGEAAWRSARSGLRGLRRAPLYAIASIATLGIGVAGVSSIHAVANWSLLRPVPGVERPDELVTILLASVDQEGAWWPISEPDLELLVERTRLLSGLAGATEQDVHIARVGGVPERVRGQVVTGAYFDVLGVRMLAGRPFTAAEADGSEQPHVLVLSERYASRHWRGAEQAVGAEMVVNGLRYTVIGVTEPGFRGEALPGASELWVPGGALPDLLHDPQILRRSGRQVWSTMIGRPTAGASVNAVEAEMNALMEAIRLEKAGEEHSFLATHFTFRAFPGVGLAPSLRSPTSRTLSILAGSAALLLLLACANIANLGLARAASLSGAIMVRRALGASGAAVAAERIIESALVGLAGGALGVILGAGAIGGLRASGLGLLGVPLDGVSLDGRVVAFTILAGVLAGVLAGLLPALLSRRERAASVLRAGRGVDRATNRTGRVLVVAQVALSVVLLVGGVLLARTLDNLRRVNLGVDDTGVLAFALDPGFQGYDQGAMTALVRELTAGLAARTDIASVGAVWSPPFELLHIPLLIKQPSAEWETGRVTARGFMVTPALFETLGIELIAGRPFRDGETWSTADRVAILNESAARAAYPGLSPSDVIGRTFDRRLGSESQPIRVVGVVRDARLERPSDASREYVFLPWAQGFYIGGFTVYVRTSQPLSATSPAIRDLVGELDPTLPVHGLRTWHDEIRSLLAEQRLVATLALGLAAFGLLLAAIGLYGVLALAVTRRTREIGIRSALGAQPRRTLAAVVGSGLLLSAFGLVPGLLAGAWLSRVLESRLYGIGRLDGGTYVIGAATLLVVVLFASWLPARRAMRVEPTIALRHE